jgi:hypothetical protein
MPGPGIRPSATTLQRDANHDAKELLRIRPPRLPDAAAAAAAAPSRRCGEEARIVTWSRGKDY